MTPDERMDARLRAGMPAPPRLSTAFDRRVARAVAPRGLTPRGRRAVVAYAIVAAVAALWALAAATVPWPVSVLALTVPIVAVAAAQGRTLRRLW